MTSDGESEANALDAATCLHIERREERREIEWIATIRLADGTEIPTTVKDVSPSGARLVVPRSYTLPERFMFRVSGRDFVCAVRVAWRVGDSAGVRIERVAKLPPQTQPEATAASPAANTPHMRARRSQISKF